MRHIAIVDLPHGQRRAFHDTDLDLEGDQFLAQHHVAQKLK